MRALAAGSRAIHALDSGPRKVEVKSLGHTSPYSLTNELVPQEPVIRWLVADGEFRATRGVPQ